MIFYNFYFLSCYWLVLHLLLHGKMATSLVVALLHQTLSHIFFLSKDHLTSVVVLLSQPPMVWLQLIAITHHQLSMLLPVLTTSSKMNQLNKKLVWPNSKDIQTTTATTSPTILLFLNLLPAWPWTNMLFQLNSQLTPKVNGCPKMTSSMSADGVILRSLDQTTQLPSTVLTLFTSQFQNVTPNPHTMDPSFQVIKVNWKIRYHWNIIKVCSALVNSESEVKTHAKVTLVVQSWDKVNVLVPPHGDMDVLTPTTQVSTPMLPTTETGSTKTLNKFLSQ